MKRDLDILLDVALAAQGSQPTAIRIQVLRAAATLVNGAAEADHLLKLAAELEAVDQRCFAFARQLSQRELPFTPTATGN
jgi:hypothetical protein